MPPTPTRLELDDARWSAFVASRQEATPLHDPEWAGFLADTYGFDAFALALEQDGEVTAGIPVIEVRSPRLRRRWVSLPFTDECGALGGPAAQLAAALDDARRDAGIASYEVRAPLPAGSSRARGVTHRLALHHDLDAIVRGYRSSIRQGMRAAERENVVVRQAEDRRDLTHTFYAMHVATRRRLGVPVQRRRYFTALWERLISPGKGYVLLAEQAGTPLAAAVFLQGNGVVLYKYGASDSRHWGLRPNNALFHEAIRRSVEAGCRVFDWGRTDHEDEGLRRFKSSWGSVESELAYTTLGAESAAIGGEGRAAALSREVIRRTPSAVSRLAGALLYRYAG